MLKMPNDRYSRELEAQRARAQRVRASVRNALQRKRFTKIETPTDTKDASR